MPGGPAALPPNSSACTHMHSWVSGEQMTWSCMCVHYLQELKAVFDRQIPKPSLPPLWSKLSHALGGLFCASLHFVARPETTAVQAITARPYAANSSSDSGSTGVSSITWRPEAAGEHVLYATLPQEASCTENLTPWLKLLPCRWVWGNRCTIGVRFLHLCHWL